MGLLPAHFAGAEIRHREVLCLAQGHTPRLVAELGFGCHVLTLNPTLSLPGAWCFVGASLLPEEEGHWPCEPHALAEAE